MGSHQPLSRYRQGETATSHLEGRPSARLLPRENSPQILKCSSHFLHVLRQTFLPTGLLLRGHPSRPSSSNTSSALNRAPFLVSRLGKADLWSQELQSHLQTLWFYGPSLPSPQRKPWEQFLSLSQDLTPRTDASKAWLGPVGGSVWWPSC